MTPISNDLLLFKGTKDVSVAEDMMVLLLMELSRTVADRVAKLLPDPWDVVVTITACSDWVVNFSVSDVKFWNETVEKYVLLFVMTFKVEFKPLATEFADTLFPV